jgi:hypothetical protein
VYARVSLANKDLEPELECFDAQTRKAEGFGELKGGMVIKCSLGMARKSVDLLISLIISSIKSLINFMLFIGSLIPVIFSCRSWGPNSPLKLLQASMVEFGSRHRPLNKPLRFQGVSKQWMKMAWMLSQLKSSLIHLIYDSNFLHGPPLSVKTQV